MKAPTCVARPGLEVSLVLLMFFSYSPMKSVFEVPSETGRGARHDEATSVGFVTTMPPDTASNSASNDLVGRPGNSVRH